MNNNMERQPRLLDVGEAEMAQTKSEESGFIDPWEGAYCAPCAFLEDYRRFESSGSMAHISPIATSYDICVLRWTYAIDRCRHFCERKGRMIEETDSGFSNCRSVVLELNDEVGRLHFAGFEQYKTPLSLLKLQQFLGTHGYSIWMGNVTDVCATYYANQPFRLYLRDYWKNEHQSVCTLLALEFVSEHNGCQLNEIEMFGDSSNWVKKCKVVGIKPKIQVLRKKGFITTSRKPHFLGGFDPSTQAEITERGNNVLDNLRQAASGLLKFMREKEGCQMSELKKYENENCADVTNTLTLLGLSYDGFNWHLPMVAPMVWTGYLEVEDKSPLESRFCDENMVRLTAKGQQQSLRAAYLPLRSLYTETETL